MAPAVRLALACALTGIASGPSAGGQQALTRDDFLADLSELSRRAAADWSYADDKRDHFSVDLEALRSAAEASLGEQPTLDDFAAALEVFVAGMKDGHAGVLVPGHSNRRSRVWPFTLADTADGLLVDAVAPGLESIGRGDKLVAVDQRPVDVCLQEAMRRSFASTDGSRRERALENLRETEASGVRCVLETPAGRLVELEFETLPAEPGLEAPPRPAAGNFHSRLAGNVGYLRLGTFAAPDPAAWARGTHEDWPRLIEPVVAVIRQAFAELADTRALILDLRGNPGGTDLLGMEVARHLVGPDRVYFQLQARLPDGSWSGLSQHEPPDGATVPRYDERLVVLIDERTFSTADNLSVCLADSLPDATFVGRPTGAGTGAPRAITLERTGASVSFCTQRVYGPAGGLTEGRGVQPDVPVRWTRDDLLSGRDADLEAALALLGNGER